MIGPAEIEDMLLDQADAEKTMPRDDDPRRTRRWGLVTTEPTEVASVVRRIATHDRSIPTTL